MVGVEVYQRLSKCLDDRARRNRRTAQLVKLAAVPSNLPHVFCRIGERSAIELVYPVGATGFDAVAEPRRLTVLDNPSTRNSAVVRQTDEQANGSCVSIPCDHDEERGEWRLVLEDPVDGCGLVAGQIVRHGDDHGRIGQRSIVFNARENGLQAFFKKCLLIVRDAFAGQRVGKGDQRRTDGRHDGENQCARPKRT